ncbi:MAG: PTS transporter subunit EIIC, partial [Stackebrandtia sp.]
WGLITAMFLPEAGWIPKILPDAGWASNENFGVLIDTMVKILLPILIGYTGGRMVHGQRGAVVGAIATTGIVVGADVPMFLGAMIIGPLAAYLMKLFDGLVEDRIKPGFEMLINNFSAGILGGAMAVLGMLGVGPVISTATKFLGTQVGWLVEHNLLPIASLIVEPAKVLFLNNAINHGVFTPLGAAESTETGQSILFMIESNPGPGFGLLLAFMFFGPRKLRPSIPAAATIQFLGGIHEIYFPYVMMKPRLILAVMAGGVAGVGTFMITGAGLIASPAPGSIFAYAAVMPPGNWFGTLAGIIIATGVSFIVAAALLGFGRPAALEARAEARAEAAAESETNADEAPATAAANASNKEK